MSVDVDNLNGLLSDVEEDVDDIVDGDSASEINVSAENMDSEAWSEYVIRQFSNDELDNGNPKCDGLRRVTHLLIGPILSSSIISNTAPSTLNEGTATVAIRVTILVTNEDHPLHGREITQDGIGDVNFRNTVLPYHLHPSATCFTRAEANALRKVLHLKNKVAAEELAPTDMSEAEQLENPWRVDEPIADEQIVAINSVAKRCNVDVLDYINSGGSGQKYQCIEQVSKSSALAMIKHLNKIQQGKSVRPKSVGDYDSDWLIKNAARKGEK